MNGLTITFRALAIAVATFIVAASALDIAGVVPHSETTPSLAARLGHSLPIGVGFAALLVPYRKVSSSRSRMILGSILLVLLVRVAYQSVDGVVQYLGGQKSWHVVPAALAMLSVIAGNFWAFLRITGKAPADSTR